MARDTKALADALGLAPLHLAGVSMGGCIAQEYAAAWPADLLSVVLANTYAAPDAFTRAAFGTWALVAERAGMPAMMRAQAPWVFSPDFYATQPERLAQFLTEMDATTQPAESVLAQAAALASHDCAARLGSITRPALVIAASDDIVIRPSLSRALHDGLPDAAWALLPGGHATFLEDPPAWNQAVITFLSQHSTS
jgi:3-oxoadipate enol-lactonase